MKKIFALLFLAQALAASPLTAQSDTVRFRLCSEFWKNGQPVNGAVLYFYPVSSGAPIWQVQLPPDQNCAEVVVAPGTFPAHTRFGYHAELYDSDFLNGVSAADFCLIGQYIMGLQPFAAPYAAIAADANKSGSITTLDVVELRKLLLGIYDELPNNTAWRFFPDYLAFSNPGNPFAGCPGCPEGISMAELLALNGGKATMLAVKTGDVDGDAALNGAPYAPAAADTLDVVLPNAALTGGAAVSVPVRFSKDITLGIFKLECKINPLLAQFVSIDPAALSLAQSSYHYDAATNALKIVYQSASEVAVAAGTVLFRINLAISEDADLGDALRVLVSDSTTLRSYAIGPNCGPIYHLGGSYSGTLSAPELPICTGVNAVMPGPNPFSENTWLEIMAEEAQTGMLEVFDLHGRLLYSASKQVPAGAYRWEIPAEAMPSSSVGFWRLSMGGNKVSGKLVKR